MQCIVALIIMKRVSCEFFQSIQSLCMHVWVWVGVGGCGCEGVGGYSLMLTKTLVYCSYFITVYKRFVLLLIMCIVWVCACERRYP